jgi:hypothetical protein
VKSTTAVHGYLVRDFDRDFPTTDRIRDVFVRASVNAIAWPIKVELEWKPLKGGIAVILSHDSSNPIEGAING